MGPAPIRNARCLSALASFVILAGSFMGAAHEAGSDSPTASRPGTEAPLPLETGECPELLESSGSEESDPGCIAARASAASPAFQPVGESSSLPDFRYRRERPLVPPPNALAPLT